MSAPKIQGRIVPPPDNTNSEAVNHQIVLKTMFMMKTYICIICNVRPDKHCLSSTFNNEIFICLTCAPTIKPEDRDKYFFPLEFTFIPPKIEPTVIHQPTVKTTSDDALSGIEGLVPFVDTTSPRVLRTIKSVKTGMSIFTPLHYSFADPNGLLEELITGMKGDIEAISIACIFSVTRFLVRSDTNGTKQYPPYMLEQDRKLLSIKCMSNTVVKSPLSASTHGFKHTSGTDSTFCTKIKIPSIRSTKFDAKDTTLMPFYTLSNDCIDVETLNLHSLMLYKKTNINSLDCSIVSFPWSKDLNAIILLPKDTIDPSFFVPPTNYTNHNLLKDLKYEWCDLYIPKFTVKSNHNMIISDYTVNCTIDMSIKDTKCTPLVESPVITHIPKSIACDRPFMFCIVNDKGNIIVTTIIRNPSDK